LFSSEKYIDALNILYVMLVVVGSSNPCKISGVRRAFSDVFKADVNVIGVKVDNVVGSQPIGFDEIYVGAYYRALNASKIYKNADFYVGIEAGIVNIHGFWMDTQMTLIMDRDGSISIGFSQCFPIPDKFVNEILSRRSELEEIVDRYYKTKDIGMHGGFIKILTKGRISREDLVYNATLIALIPWMNKEVFK